MENWQVGPHLLEFEPPDLFHMYVRGPITGPDVEVIARRWAELEARGFRFFFVGHVDAAQNHPSSDAWKVLTNWKTDFKGILMVGASPLYGAAVNLMIQSLNVLWRKSMLVKVVKTMEDGRHWLEEIRAKEAAKAGPSEG